MGFEKGFNLTMSILKLPKNIIYIWGLNKYSSIVISMDHSVERKDILGMCAKHFCLDDGKTCLKDVK